MCRRCPGTEEPITDRNEALKIAKSIGFPLIIKAAFGGGGRGMRVVQKAGDLDNLLDEAQGEAGRAFGNPAVFLEKYIPRAKHIEVQILGDKHGNVLHLHERDCSVQRRHQKVVEIAPSCRPGRARSPGALRRRRAHREGDRLRQRRHGRVPLRSRSQRMVLHRDEPAHPGRAHGHGSDHRHRPRARADSHRAGPVAACARGRACRAQDEIPRNGFAMQCRITTEDPENKFTPDYGKILTYRSAGGFGVRLDGGMGYAGAVITPFYDSLLVKITASGRRFEMALQRMDRALREFRIRGVKTNIPFLENVIHNADVPLRPGDDDAHRHHAGAVRVQAAPRSRDEAAELPRRRHRQRQSAREGLQARREPLPHVAAAGRAITKPSRPGARADLLLELGPKKFAEWTREAEAPAHHRHDVPRRAPVAHGHARAQLRHAGRRRRRRAPHAGAVLARDVGRRDLRHGDAFPAAKIRGNACASCARRCRTSVSRCSFAARTPWATRTIPTTSSPVS